MAVSNEQVAELLTLVKDHMTLMKEQQERSLTPSASPSTKAKRPDRPVINAGIDDREWTLFLDTWSRYKHMIGATDLVTIRMELRAACSPDVNKMLFEFVGPDVLNECSEEELLAYIKSIPVKQIHHDTSNELPHDVPGRRGTDNPFRRPVEITSLPVSVQRPMCMHRTNYRELR